MLPPTVMSTVTAFHGSSGFSSVQPMSSSCAMLVHSHRITRWFGSEGTLQITQFQPLPWAGTAPTSPHCSEPHPPGPELFQGWGIHRLGFPQVIMSLELVLWLGALLTASGKYSFSSLLSKNTWDTKILMVFKRKQLVGIVDKNVFSSAASNSLKH